MPSGKYRIVDSSGVFPLYSMCPLQTAFDFFLRRLGFFAFSGKKQFPLCNALRPKSFALSRAH